MFKSFYKRNSELPCIPNPVKIKSRDYLAGSDNLFDWFSQHYTKVAHGEYSIIYCGDIYKRYSNSDYFSKLPKSVQRYENKTKFEDKLKTNLFLSSCFKQRNDTIDLGGTKKQIRKPGLYGWKEIEEI